MFRVNRSTARIFERGFSRFPGDEASVSALRLQGCNSFLCVGLTKTKMDKTQLCKYDQAPIGNSISNKPNR